MKIRKRKDETNLPMRRNEFGDMLSIRDVMDQLFDESFWRPFELSSRLGRTVSAPRVDISESESMVIVKADVPGVDAKDIDIEVTEDSIRISGSFEEEVKDERKNYYRLERQSGSFAREFALPATIDPDSVEAKAKNGVITIMLKKIENGGSRKVVIEEE
jgi:HSP20 family protein